jgi:chaperone required for assembly of F1-ATPase
MLEKSSPDARLDQSFARPAEAADPIAMARRDLSKTLPRRFYKEVAVQQRDGACLLLLDGRPAKSPGGNHLALPCLAAARVLADEWSAQGETIDPAALPLTRIVNSAIDRVAYRRNATRDEIARYAEADLVCYRAARPTMLIEAQAAAWDPILAFAREKLGAHFICAEGVAFIEQPEPARTAVKEAIMRVANSDPTGPFALAALHVMTTFTGSSCSRSPLRMAHTHPRKPGLPRMWTRTLKCGLGARTRKPSSAARGNGARWRRPHACFRPSMALRHEKERVFAK